MSQAVESPTLGRMAHHAIAIAAAVAAVVSCVAVARAYGSLPELLPVTRWRNAAKTPLLAMRVPLINLLMVALALLLWRVIARGVPLVGRRVGPILAATAATKSVLEAVELLSLPRHRPVLTGALGACVVLGLLAAAATGRSLLTKDGRKPVRLARSEKIVAATLVAGIVALNVPLAF